MSRLENGVVASEEIDRYALHRHLAALDRLCGKLGLRPLSEFLDTTDLEFNVGDGELPEGMESTDELMARDGHWFEPAEGSRVMGALIDELEQRPRRFGLLSNAYADVVADLRGARDWIDDAARRGAQFNLAVVM